MNKPELRIMGLAAGKVLCISKERMLFCQDVDAQAGSKGVVKTRGVGNEFIL